MNNFKIAENFKLYEFECTHINHRHVRVDEELVEKLQTLRNKTNKKVPFDVPLSINSAYRCPERNRQVDGADDSQHLYGKAADISLHTIPMDIIEIKALAKKVGFNGIGLYNTFIHLDVRHRPAEWDKRE